MFSADHLQRPAWFQPTIEQIFQLSPSVKINQSLENENCLQSLCIVWYVFLFSFRCTCTIWQCILYMSHTYIGMSYNDLLLYMYIHTKCTLRQVKRAYNSTIKIWIRINFVCTFVRRVRMGRGSFDTTPTIYVIYFESGFFVIRSGFWLWYIQ